MSDQTYTEAELQAAISAAVQVEREACIVAVSQCEDPFGGHEPEVASAWETIVEEMVAAIRSRGPAPAVVCPECDGERWHEYENPLTGEITNRTPCATCNGAEEVPGPAPAVDVLGIVREYVEASEAFDAAYVDPASGVELGKRLDTKWHALRALVDGGLQS